MATGLAPSVIRQEFDVPLLESLREVWEKYPPLNEMVAHYFQIPAAAERRQLEEASSGAEFKLAFPQKKRALG